MPGGVDEFLRVIDERNEAAGSGGAKQAAGKLAPCDATRDGSADTQPALTGGEAYQARKTLASTERKIAALEEQADRTQAAMHDIDPTDFVTLGDKQAELQALRDQIAELEELWIDLSEKLGD